MKYTVIFWENDFHNDKVAIIKEFVHKLTEEEINILNRELCETMNIYFIGWYGHTLKEATDKYMKNPSGILRGCIHESIRELGTQAFSYPEKNLTMLYEISEEEFQGLLDLEKLTGGL